MSEIDPGTYSFEDKWKIPSIEDPVQQRVNELKHARNARFGISSLSIAVSAWFYGKNLSMGLLEEVDISEVALNATYGTVFGVGAAVMAGFGIIKNRQMKAMEAEHQDYNLHNNS